MAQASQSSEFVLIEFAVFKQTIWFIGWLTNLLSQFRFGESV
jgi:hypothetical protein